MQPTLQIASAPTELEIVHPRGSARTYQFQVVDPNNNNTPLDLTALAANVTDIVALLKVQDDDDDTAFLLKKSLLVGGIVRSAGPGAVTAVNGWFDLIFADTDCNNVRLFPEEFQFKLGVKIYPQRQNVVHATFEVSGGTVQL